MHLRSYITDYADTAWKISAQNSVNLACQILSTNPRQIQQ